MSTRVGSVAGLLCLLGVAVGCGGGTAPTGGQAGTYDAGSARDAGATPDADAGTVPDAGPPTPARKTLTVAKSGAGAVRSTPAGIDCGGACSATFDVGTNVLLLAAPNPGWTFSGWTGPCGGAGACSVALTADIAVGAKFQAVAPQRGPLYKLEVARAGDGKGRVTSNPGGIDCGRACSVTFAEGTAVALTATPEAGSSFAGWGGACSGSGGCAATISRDTGVTATFSLLPAPDECAGLAPSALPAMVAYQETYSTGSQPTFCEGLPIGNGDGIVGMLTWSLSHPTYRLADPGGKSLGVIGVWHGEVWPAPRGFIGYSGSSTEQVVVVSSWTSSGGNAGSDRIRGDGLFAPDPDGGLFAVGRLTRSPEQLVPPPETIVQMFNSDATTRWGPLPLGTKAVVLGAGVDLLGRAVVILDGGPGSIDAVWFDQQGANLTGTFRVLSNFQAGPSTSFETSPLIGGGLALRRMDAPSGGRASEVRTSEWVALLPSGRAAVDAVPRWLAQRPNTNMTPVRARRAYAFTPWGTAATACDQRAEIVARTGTGCGTADFPVDAAACTTRELRVGLDGTVLQMLPASREQNQPAGSTVYTCTLRYWPAAFR
ncbi:MAG: hypothetical protein NVSMB23_18540 [Myxococcales bacterium]